MDSQALGGDVPNRGQYRPVALHHLLKEVERELRMHDRLSAALMVRQAARTVAQDIDDEDAPPPQRQMLM